jgi:two-component system, chemotaxis family, protein-glutamate methylesterase/glutaminase
MATVEKPVQEPARSVAQLAARDSPVELVAVGASAGGVEALQALVATLPRDFPAALLVVLHVAEAGTSVLPDILDRAGPLPAATALDREPLQAGRVYVAPPGRHLLVADGTLRLSRGPRENGHRPAIDALFRGVADAYGARGAGVVLSGTLDDGTAGLRRIAERGGATLVQDPDTALYPGMPRSAVAHVAVDAILPLPEIGPALRLLAGRLAGEDREALTAPHPPVPPPSPSPPVNGQPSRFTCPDCGGVLLEYRDGSVERHVCSVGHAYSLESLVDGQAHQLEAALWAAVRGLEDRAVLLRRMERHSRDTGRHRAELRFEERAREATEQAAHIRAMLEDAGEAPVVAPHGVEPA